MMGVGFYAQSPCNNQTSVTYQGYEYDIVEIGDQCWFAENCRYLPSVNSSSEGSETDPYYYVYDYQGTDVEEAMATTNYETYGVLYNWPAVMTEGVCPSGWHIPSEGEFTELTDFLGGVSVAGGKIKEAGYDHWNSPNTGATNSSGWTGLPGGYGFGGEGNFGKERFGSWWSASEYYCMGSWSGSYAYDLIYSDDDFDWDDQEHEYFFSARCISDYSTTSSVSTEPSSNRKLEKVVDALGREVNHTPNQILFHIYDDGSVEKKFVVE